MCSLTARVMDVCAKSNFVTRVRRDINRNPYIGINSKYCILYNSLKYVK